MTHFYFSKDIIISNQANLLVLFRSNFGLIHSLQIGQSTRLLWFPIYFCCFGIRLQYSAQVGFEQLQMDQPLS